MQVPRCRQRNAAPIQLQHRDRNIFLLLYYCDGLLSEEQLIRFCFRDTHPKNAQKRLLALFDHRYLNRNCKPEQWQIYPKVLYWLGKRGYDEVALLLGVEPDRSNKIARSQSAVTLVHHLQVVDIRLKVAMDIESHPDLQLGRWFSDGFFRSRAWQGRVRYEDAQGQEVEKAVAPDGFFPVWRWIDQEAGKKQIFAFTLELDRATEVQQAMSSDQRPSIEDKLRKGAALLESQAYRDTFRLNTGRGLLVTTGLERMQNMMALARNAAVSWAWYFTTFEQATDGHNNILTDPIWHKADRQEPTSLIPPG